MSPESTEQIAAGRSKHKSKAIMLSDVDLALIRALEIENRAAMVKPPGVSGLPIPTTFLLDEQGVIRWIDLTDDYVKRSEPERVLAAIKANLRLTNSVPD